MPNGSANGVVAGAASNDLKWAPSEPALEGFDAGKLADAGHLTAKYKFARVAQQYRIESVTSKSAAESLLNTMKADLQAAGLDVKNHKIKIKDDAGQDAWIDVLRGAGSGRAAAWQWLDTRF